MESILPVIVLSDHSNLILIKLLVVVMVLIASGLPHRLKVLRDDISGNWSFFIKLVRIISVENWILVNKWSQSVVKVLQSSCPYQVILGAYALTFLYPVLKIYCLRKSSLYQTLGLLHCSKVHPRVDLFLLDYSVGYFTVHILYNIAKQLLCMLYLIDPWFIRLAMQFFRVGSLRSSWPDVWSSFLLLLHSSSLGGSFSSWMVSSVHYMPGLVLIYLA